MKIHMNSVNKCGFQLPSSFILAIRIPFKVFLQFWWIVMLYIKALLDSFFSLQHLNIFPHSLCPPGFLMMNYDLTSVMIFWLRHVSQLLISKQFEYVLIVLNKYVRYWYLSFYTYAGYAAIPDPVVFKQDKHSRYDDTHF